MIAFYPGAEPECDGCPKQLSLNIPEWDDPDVVTPALFCDRYQVALLYYYPWCMRERKESQDD